MTLIEFLERSRLTCKVESISARTDRLCGGMYHYLFVLGYRDNSFGGFFSRGSAHKLPPSIQDILECLQSDCRAGGDTYREFCNEYGHNAENYQTWKACRNTRDGLIDLFGRGVFKQFMEMECD